MTSKETSKKYTEEFQNTKIQKRETPNIEEPLIFNMNFVRNPFFEIKGNTDKKFEVSFFNSKNILSYKTTLSANMWSKLNISYFQEWKVLVESDNFKKVFVYNCKNKSVYISLDSSSLGDTIAWIPYVEEFRKKWECQVIVSTFWNKLFIKSYPNLEFIEPGTMVHNLYAMYVLGCFYDSNLEPELCNTIPLQKVASNILGLDHKEIRPMVDYSEEDYCPVSLTKPYVVIAPHSTAGLKYWNNPTGWQEVVDYLIDSGYRVFNVSREGCDFKGVENLKTYSMDEIMNHIKGSEFFIGLSSGLSWLAWAMNKKVVLISNFTNREHEFSEDCIRVVNESVCNSCWVNPNFKFDKGDWNWCPIHKDTNRQFECSKTITGKMVINRIKNIEKLSQFDWGWMSENMNQKNILIKEIFEERIYERLFEVEEGDVVLDIGSSVGPFIFSSSEKIKHAYCLEPSDVEFDTLLKNMKNIPSTCLKKGISNKTGEIKTEYVYGGQEKMDSISFKDLIDEYSIEKIDFLKTDCEGGEYDIFTLDNIDWIKKNVRKISGEWHLSNNELKEKFRNFRDNILYNFTNFEVYSIDGVDIKWNLYNENFIEYYSEVLFYIKNEDR
jgi:autotransporter strand-loop-strand O-heptosyltransferase